MNQFKGGMGPYGSSDIIGSKVSFYQPNSSRVQPKICRLCLSEINGVFTRLEGVIKDMLEIILPELKLGICDSPSICSACLETLKQSYNFKSSCLEAEDKVQGFINPGTPVLIDLKLVVSNNMNRMPVQLGARQCICRTCLNIVASTSCTKLYSFEGDPLKNMIDKCLPEMGIELTKEPLICPICLEMLEEQFHFLMQCLDTEEKINYYCEKKNCHSKIDLRNVYLYSMCIDDEGNEQLEREGDSVSVITDSVQSTSQEINKLLDISNDMSSTKLKKGQNHISIKKEPQIAEIENVTDDNEDNISETISVTSMGDILEMTVASSEKSSGVKSQEKRPLQGKLVPKNMNSPKKEDIISTKKGDINKTAKEEPSFKDEDDDEDAQSLSDEDFDDFAYYPNGPRRKAPKKCRFCDFKTKSSRSFKSHMTHKHQNKRITRSDFKNRRSSTSASESTTDVDMTNSEIIDITDSKNFKCEMCGKKFDAISSLKRHITVVHSKIETEDVKVKTAPKTSTFNEEVSSPLLYVPKPAVHNNSGNFSGIKRPLPAFKDGNMAKKTLYGSTATPMPYSTKQTYRFDRHMLTMYKCRLCPYQTRLKSNFTKHQQTHKKTKASDIIKVHKCEVENCTFETVQKESLLTHMKSHDVEPEEQFRKCFLCSFTTKKVEHLKKHVKEVHKAGSG